MNGSITYTQPAGAGGGGGGTITDVTEISGVKVVTSGTTKELFNRLAYFFVDQYGAVGDGVTDDTAAIQAAFTAAGAAGGGNNVVYFPQGSYLVTARIVFPSGKAIQVMGSGGGPYAGNLGDRVSEILCETDGIDVFSADGSNVSIERMAFTCTIAQTSGSAMTYTGNGLTLRECYFSGQFFNGVVQTEHDVSVVERCSFFSQVNHMLDYSNASNADEGDGLILGCVFVSAVSTNVAVYSKGSGGLKISGCKFVSPQDASTSTKICIQYEIPDGTFSTSDLLVSNCSIEQFSSSGINMAMDNGGGRFANVVIVGNQIGSFQGGNGIEMNGTASDLETIVITGNAIVSCESGLRLTGVFDVIVTGNAFANNALDVNRIACTNFYTGFQGDDNGAAPVNPVTPAAWSDVIIYTAAGAVTYKVPLYL